MTRDEMDTLQYEVSLNGVNEEFRHVLDSEAAKYVELEPAQMYNTVKHHEHRINISRSRALTLVSLKHLNRLPGLPTNLDIIKPLLLQ